MADNISPEEKLFNIIQKGKGAPPAFQARPARRQGKPALEIKALPALMRKKLQAIASVLLSAHPGEIDIKKANIVLGAILAILASLAIYKVVNAGSYMARFTKKMSKIEYQKIKRKEIEDFKPLSFYMGKIRERNILRPVPKEPEKKEPKARPAESATTLKSEAAGFTLKGISWGKSPKAIIKIEENDRVYFVSQGQAIGATGIKVKLISREKVTIGYEEEEMDLL